MAIGPKEAGGPIWIGGQGRSSELRRSGRCVE
jgi:hypothetical protein